MKAESACPFLFEAKEQRIAALDGLSRKLWLGAATHTQGDLEPRLQALVSLRAALVAGRLPRDALAGWPAPTLATALAATLEQLGLAGYCADQLELADTVLLSILVHLDFIVDYRDRGASEAQAMGMALSAFAEDWKERCGQIDELVEVFGLLPEDGKNTRWDMIRGLLRSEGWQDVVRIRRLLERLPELSRLIRNLGRAQQNEVIDEFSHKSIPIMEQAIAQRPDGRTVRVPDLPGQTRGVQRSDRFARMLPAEAMLLGHPTLRMVWHARRAERTLLCYEDDDRMQEIRLHEALVWRPNPQPVPERHLEMGPIIICVDTSGSMQGGAEAVAKATVLEAVRTAHAQKRACHVFAFGGPDEVVEMELAVDAQGIERLMRFLGQAFCGGTDICGPLEKAIAKLEDKRWQLADLLVASDGEFGATREVTARLDRIKAECGLRVQGFLIGDRETIGLLEVCDDIYWVRDWRRYGAFNVESPLQSKSVTATFFPGALRSPQSRQPSAFADAAALAVRAGVQRGEGDADTGAA